MDRGTLPRVYLAPDSKWWKIDLREWSGPRMVARNPADSGWPARGRRTESREVASSWAPAYLEWLGSPGMRYRGRTLAEAVEAHLEHRAATVERATWSCDRTAANHLLRAFYPATRLGAIRTAELQELVDDMLRRGYKPTTLDTYRRSWSVLFGRLAGADPTADLYLGTKHEAPLGEVRAFTPAEVARLLEAAAKIDLQRIGEFPSGVLACTLGLSMGLRQGEIFALQWADIDPTTRTVRIRFQVPKDRLELRPTKGKWARTALVLPDWWAHHRADAVGFVVGRTGRPVGTRTQRNLITRILDSSGLNRKGLGWHVLRHTFALRFLESGGSMEQLQKSLGHSSIVTTQSRYDSFRPDIAAAAARRAIYQE